jgi:CheY-like chemotaxis protein
LALRIVVVDDEPDICRLIQVALSMAGYEVVEAHDGEEGLRLIEKTRPALAILDIVMPKMNGYELLAKLRANPTTAAIKVIISTSVTEGSTEDDEEWARRMDVSGFLTKPYNPEAMIRLVDEILGNPG